VRATTDLFISTYLVPYNANHSASDPDTHITTISLLPGTHHIKFIVDDNWRLTQDLPTAVDDDGSLANYVSVNPPPAPSTPASPPPAASATRTPGQISFWSQSSDAGGGTSFGDEGWTNVIPPELTAAAREEEVYLANQAAGIAPNIPPAPVLPRHLDKLILNTRVGAPPAPVKDRRHRARSRHGELGMTKPEQDEPSAFGSSHIPVTTASGTDVSAARHGHPQIHSHSPMRPLVGGSTPPQGTTAAALMLADDASVLPVPSHVVLQHLSTSAIRNGVLAVGNTTRYRKKVRYLIFSSPRGGISHVSFLYAVHYNDLLQAYVMAPVATDSQKIMCIRNS
jgi:hypothetical protein